MCKLSTRHRLLLVIVGVLFALTGQLATAQSRADIFLGYSYTGNGFHYSEGTGHFRLESTGRATLNGWDVSASVRLARWLRGAADVGGGSGTIPMRFTQFVPSLTQTFNANTNLHTYLLGPRVAATVGHITPFAQLLFGVAHQSVAASAFITNVPGRETAFAFALGGGLDFPLVSRLRGRIGADYLQTTLFHGTQHNPRVTAGFVVRF